MRAMSRTSNSAVNPDHTARKLPTLLIPRDLDAHRATSCRPLRRTYVHIGQVCAAFGTLVELAFIQRHIRRRKRDHGPIARPRVAGLLPPPQCARQRPAIIALTRPHSDTAELPGARGGEKSSGVRSSDQNRRTTQRQPFRSFAISEALHWLYVAGPAAHNPLQNDFVQTRDILRRPGRLDESNPQRA